MIEAIQEKPLIYTSKGNLPIDDLRYEHFWHDTDDFMKFTENYYLDDELVKSSCHVYMKKGMDSLIEQVIF